ncbi:WXG100 family type VII secretion target [Kitasatospora sp. NPDC088391]|uniref:WXG100 family type VII secretion target n=1 Tax=Kitasatospora sp. NPDC088391 TaxID=3364074 RepID=UPI00381247BD
MRFPSANEDELNQLADQLEKFAGALDSAQMTADRALTMLHEVYQGDSADRLSELWSTITKYSKVVVDLCQTVAKVLRAAAVVVELAKTQSITQLFSIQAQLAAASSTGPWSTAAVLQMGRMIMNQLLDAAVSKLASTLTKPIEDMIDKAAQQIAPTPAARSNSQGFNIDLAQLASCAMDLRRGSDDIESHGLSFQRIAQGLKMGDSGDRFGKIVIEIAQHILQTIAETVLKRILGSFRSTADKMDKLAGNLGENEDSNRLSLNSIASTVANPYSPNTALNSASGSGFSGGGSSRGSSDAGLGAFAALMPKLGPVGSRSGGIGGIGGLGGGSRSGVNTLGLKEPNLSAASGGHGGGGSGSDGGPGSSGGVHGPLGVGTRLAVPGSGGSGSSPRVSTKLETDRHLDGGVSSSGGSGSVGTSTNSAGARPGGMVGGPMGMGMAHGFGPVGGGGGSRGAGGGGAAGRRGQHVGGEDEEEQYSDGIVAEDPLLNMYAALQLGRVMPVRQDGTEDEPHERDSRYDGEFDEEYDEI